MAAPRLSLLLCAALLASYALLAPALTQDSTNMARSQTGCGELNAVCCELQVSDSVTQSVCNTQGLYCKGDRCASVPSGCGQVNQRCCPGNAGVPYCTAADSTCLPRNATAAADNEEGANEDRICRPFPASPDYSACGQQNALCDGGQGAWPAAPAPQCPLDKRSCPDGYYCWRPSTDLLGVCLALPPNCGQKGARCCPPGLYGGSPPRNVTAYFCTNSSQTHVYCSGWGGMPGAGVCEYWPQYPGECGQPGKRCCRNLYHSWLDAATPPPICQAGSWCGGHDAAGTCVENPKDCGTGVGKPCCTATTPSTTVLYCKEGFYCPYEQGDVNQCRACPSSVAEADAQLYQCQNPGAFADFGG